MNLNIPEQTYIMLGEGFVAILIFVCFIGIALFIASIIKDYREAILRTKTNTRRITELHKHLHDATYELGYEVLIIKRKLGLIKGGNKMNFGEALEALKHGNKVYRKGWNGKGMFVVYQKGYPDGIPCNKQTAEAWGMEEGELFKVEPYLQIKMVNGSHAMWVPSINDVLAEDWSVCV